MTSTTTPADLRAALSSLAYDLAFASTPEGEAELLRLLEDEVVPAYYDRDANDLPRRWLEMMAASIARVGELFNAERMVVDYVEKIYLPAHENAVRSARSPAGAGSPTRR